MTSIIRVQFDSSLSVRMFPTPRKLLGCSRKDQFSIDQDLLLSGKTAVFQFHLTGRRFSRCEKKRKKATFLVFIIEVYIHPSTDVPKNTKNSSTYALIHRLIRHTQVSPIVTFNSVASKKKVQAWRNFEDFMCRPMWSTWYCGDRIPQNTASSIPLPGWFPQIPWNFSPSYYRNSMVLPPWWVFPTQNHWRLSGTTSPSLVDSYFMKKNVRNRFERFIYHIIISNAE